MSLGSVNKPAACSGRANDLFIFADALEPLLAPAKTRLRAELTDLLARYPRLVYHQSATSSLDRALVRRVHRMAARTLVLELNVARLQGTLAGDTPEERFADFMRRFDRPEVLATLLCEYPELARQIAIRVEQWAASSLEFIERLCHDWEILRDAFFAGSDPGPLVGVDCGQGDAHRGGRAVMIAHFACGAALVYKPRSLAVDRHFYELLEWLNARGSHPAFRKIAIVDRGTYGWEEYVARSACETPEQVERFYQRCGAYLALLYAFDANDFHFENLIAAGEHPVLVDLETLLHPVLPSGPEIDASDVAWSAIGSSVLAVGLLPQRLWSGPESAGLDISGLGAEPNQVSPFEIPVLGRVGTDRMAFAPARVPVGGSSHRPSLRGNDVDAVNHADAIAQGFAAMYELLRVHRGELLAPGGPVDSFAGDEVRVILRPTQTYAELLATSFHPDFLRDAFERDALFEKLRTIAHVPGFECVVPDECEDLRRGDIPAFTTSPQSSGLLTSTGRRIEGVFPESGLASVRRGITRLDDDDLAAQLWYVGAALGNVARREPSRRRVSRRRADRERLLAAATAIGERLERLAFHGAEGATWIGASVVDERRVSVQPLGPDLYDGLPGVALFLAHLGVVTGESRFTELARRALATMRVELDRGGLSVIGALAGWGGVVYALAQLGSLWNEPGLFDEAAAYADRINSLIGTDRSFDIVEGAAGCIVSLLALDACARSAPIRAIAQRCGEHLLANMAPEASGVGWASGNGGVPLTGFSHGAAGIALALLRLHAVTRDERFREAALAAIAYERSVFSGDAGNWPDLRARSSREGEAPAGQAFQALWCHGAPGIGLARLASAEFLDDGALDTEIDAAIRTTYRDGFRGGHSLCHGSLGNLELLHVAARRAASPLLKMFVLDFATTVLNEAERDGWRCGNPAGVESPGLMTGLAGIGYQLLRLAEPAHVPSLLSFEAPIGAPPAARACR